MSIKSFIKNHNLPINVQKNLKKQDRDRAKFEVNTGNDRKPYGLAKTFYESIEADEDTAILSKSYDFAEKKKNPDPDKISFPKFTIPYGLGYFIKNYYKLPGRKEERLVQWARAGVPEQYIKDQLPDNGKKYSQAFSNPEDNPVITVYQFLNSKWVKEKDRIVWEENPHQPLTEHITMSFITHKDQFQWNELSDDPEKVVENISNSARNSKGILNHIVRYDLHEELNDGTLYMFLSKMRDYQRSLDKLEKDTSKEAKVSKMPAKIDGEEYLWQVPNFNDFKGYYFKTNFWDVGEDFIPVDVFKYVWTSLKPSIHDKVETAYKNNNYKEVQRLSELLKNLETLTKFKDSNFNKVVNWKFSDSSGQGKTPKRGVSPFGIQEGKQAYLTLHKSYLVKLKELSEEHDIQVTINYANADMSDAGMIKRKVPNAQEFQIDVKGSLQTTIHHVKQSFAKSRITEKRRNGVKAIKKILQELGSCKNVSYQDYGLGEDLYFGNSKGFGFDVESLMATGTPRKEMWQYGIKHLLVNGCFPTSTEYTEDKGYHVPDEGDNIDNSWTILCYGEDSLNEIYKHMVLDEKVDGFFRNRKQITKKKELFIFGQNPPRADKIFKNCNKYYYDTYNDLLQHLLTRLAVKGDQKTYDLPMIPKSLPKGLYRKNGKLHRIESNRERIIELVQKGVNERRKIADQLDLTEKTVKSHAEKSEQLMHLAGKKGELTKVHPVFDLKDIL